MVSQIYLPLPLFGDISEVYGVSAATAGLIATVFGITYAAGFLFFGPLSDWVGRKAVMIPGLVGLALASVLVALVPGFWGVIVGRAVQGFVATALPPVALAYLQERLPDSLKTFGIGCMTLGFLLAGPLGQIYGGAMGTLSAAMLPLAAVYTLAAALIVLLPEGREKKEGGEEAGTFISAYKGMGSLLADGALVRVYAGTLTLLFAFVGFYAAIGLFGAQAIEGAGMDPATVRAAAIPAVFLTLVAPFFVVRYGPARVVSAGFVIGAAGLFACAAVAAFSGLGSAGAVWLLIAASVVFVGGQSIAQPSVIALVGSLAPDRRGAAVALYSFVLFVGASLGPQLPPLVSRFVEGGGGGVAAVCAVLGVLWVGAAILNVGTKRLGLEHAAGSQAGTNDREA